MDLPFFELGTVHLKIKGTKQTVLELHRLAGLALDWWQRLIHYVLSFLDQAG
jgi:hypothetical protein